MSPTCGDHTTSSQLLPTTSSFPPLNTTSSFPLLTTIHSSSHPLPTTSCSSLLSPSSSSHLPTSSSFPQQEVRRGSFPTSPTATSSTVDDTDSSLPSIPSSSRQPCCRSNGVTPPDTYSIVGSLNRRSSRGGGVPGASVGGGPEASIGSLLYQGAGHLLNTYTPGGREELCPPSTKRGEGGGRELAASLPMRMEDFLNFRLKRVTFDLSQPPYDSLQTYEFEGRGSRAGSLSSLESEEAGEEGEERGGAGGRGMVALNQKFQRLVEIIRERESEMEGDKEERKEEEAVEKETDKQETEKELKDEEEKEKQRWDF
ncbi:unnamed protein product [Merluccius merluccius]